MRKYIKLRELSKLLKGSAPFLLMWSLDGCPDCRAVFYDFLPTYTKAPFTSKLPFYVIETKKWRKKGKEKAYKELKDKYGLSETFNPKLGYHTGFVPTLQIIKPNGTNILKYGPLTPVIIDMFVFQNEFVSEKDGHYFISHTYFDGKRGQKYLGYYASEVNNEIDPALVNQRNMSVRRYPTNAAYLKKFLDYYFKA